MGLTQDLAQQTRRARSPGLPSAPPRNTTPMLDVQQRASTARYVNVTSGSRTAEEILATADPCTTSSLRRQPGVSLVRTSSSATRLSLMFRAWETRRSTANA